MPVAKRNFRLRHNHNNEGEQPLNVSKVPSTICVAADQESGNRISGRVPHLSSFNMMGPESHALKQYSEWVGSDRMASVYGFGESYSSLQSSEKKRKRSKDRDSSKKQKRHAMRKESKRLREDVEASDSVPSTIQIAEEASPSMACLSGRHLNSEKKAATTMLSKLPETNVAIAPTKKDKKHSHSKHKISKEKKKSKHSKKDRHDKVAQGVSKSPELEVGAPKMNRQKPSESTLVSSSSNKSSTEKGLSKTNPHQPIASQESQASFAHRDASKTEKVATKQEGTKKRLTKKRLLLWAGLLSERPPRSDDDGMSKWLMNVMKVSDLEQPLAGEDGSSFSDETPPSALEWPEGTVSSDMKKGEKSSLPRKKKNRSSEKGISANDPSCSPLPPLQKRKSTKG